MSVGRPTDYRPEYCEQVEEHLAGGKSLTTFGGKVGTHRDTLYEWASVHPDFSDAIKRGRSRGQELWEDRLANLALTAEGNATAVIFAMKNLYRDDWNDRVVNEHTGKDGGPIKTEETGAGAAKLAAYLDAITSRTTSDSAEG